MAREIKVKIKGKISDYNVELFNRQLAITLMKELGTEKCGILLELLNQKELQSNIPLLLAFQNYLFLLEVVFYSFFLPSTFFLIFYYILIYMLIKQ